MIAIDNKPTMYSRAMDILEVLMRNDDVLLPEDHKEAIHKTNLLVRTCTPAFKLLVILRRAKDHELSYDDFVEAVEVAEDLTDFLAMESERTTGGIRKAIRDGDIEKLKKVSKEDLENFEENERQRDLWTPEGVKNLMAAVCDQAVCDYKSAKKAALYPSRHQDGYYSPFREMKRLEQFFGTEFFLDVSGLRSREHAIETITKTMVKEKKQELMNKMI